MNVRRNIRFGVVGSGWRSGCYLRTASLVGEGCRAVGLAGRNPATRAALAARYQVPAFESAAELVEKAAPAFLLVSVQGEASASVLSELMALGIPLLAETPPASSLGALEALWEEAGRRGARIQVAEQYWLQPLQAARLAAIDEGLIGHTSYAQVSVNHSYHNISLMRKYLGAGFADAEIRASARSFPRVAGPGREGPPTEERIESAEQILGCLDFDGKGRGLFDFEANQHRSWIRSERVVVRGERGELADSSLSYLKDFGSPVFGELKRIQTGGDSDFEDYYLKGIMLGDRWLYRNPFAPARLSDEEISQAAVLKAMEDYVATGEDFYPLAEACQDQYLALLLKEAAKSGEVLRSRKMAWAR